ncbi:MAG TPA: tetratricopeptide repeat protein [Acidobacteriota bacterium]
MNRSQSLTGYTTAEVARLLELSESRIRSYVRAGCLEPRRGRRGEYRFSFQDLIILRAARALSEARISIGRIRRVLHALRQQLPTGRSLSSVHISVRNREVVVRNGAEVWSPESGQTLFDFEVADLAREVAPLARRAAEQAESQAEQMSADDWYALGCDLETADPDRAHEAYLRAIGVDPRHADAHLNLGRVLHQKGQVAVAEKHYRMALAVRGDDAIAAFNLAVALEDLRRPVEALKGYQRAIEIDPSHADAHYNIAMLYERLKRRTAALRHLKVYKKLTESR